VTAELPRQECGEAKARSPEEVRDLMSAYQTGTLKARSDAGPPIPALTAPKGADPAPPAEPDDDE
jgi:hypothetical protein